MIITSDNSGVFSSNDGQRWCIVYGGGPNSVRFSLPKTVSKVDAGFAFNLMAESYNDGYSKGSTAGKVKIQQELRTLLGVATLSLGAPVPSGQGMTPLGKPVNMDESDYLDRGQNRDRSKPFFCDGPGKFKIDPDDYHDLGHGLKTNPIWPEQFPKDQIDEVERFLDKL